jgi:hypothetical protein
MTLNEILQDILALEEKLRIFERKYGVLSETFYQFTAASNRFNFSIYASTS